MYNRIIHTLFVEPEKLVHRVAEEGSIQSLNPAFSGIGLNLKIYKMRIQLFIVAPK